MSTMLFDLYTAQHPEGAEPAWVREERLDYCEKTVKKNGAGSFLASLRFLLGLDK